MVDSFFVNPAKSSKKRRPDAAGLPGRGGRREPKNRTASPTQNGRDEHITSESESNGGDSGSDDDDGSSGSESEHETAADKRRKLAKEYLASLEKEYADGGDFDAEDLDRDIISRRLRQDVAEDQGRIFRDLSAAKVSSARHNRAKGRHLTGVAATWPHAYTISKDMLLQKWRLDAGHKPQVVATQKIGFKNAGLDRGHADEILCVASSPNGQYVVTGGRDRRIIVWSAENLALVKVFDLKDRRGTALSLTFRRGSLNLYAGCADLRVRTFDLAQLSQVEVLYGHQDQVVDIAALGQERCVSVGARDRTAILWKIPEESRLTFRGGDTRLAARLAEQSAGNSRAKDESTTTGTATTTAVLEGSIDCCTMLDAQYFVTGSDNGNVSLWSTQRKKPVDIFARGHGNDPALLPAQASGETDPSLVEIPPVVPRYITAVAAVPFSNVFFTGSWSGTINMWRVADNMRQIELVREIAAPKGIVTRLTVTEKTPTEFVVVASLSREPRLGRWISVKGHDAIVVVTVTI